MAIALPTSSIPANVFYVEALSFLFAFTAFIHLDNNTGHNIIQPGIIITRKPQLDEAASSSIFSRPREIKKKRTICRK
jgi:hypothetical protein